MASFAPVLVRRLLRGVTSGSFDAGAVHSMCGVLGTVFGCTMRGHVVAFGPYTNISVPGAGGGSVHILAMRRRQRIIRRTGNHVRRGVVLITLKAKLQDKRLQKLA